ncbi:g5282 [Coccomyxa elongata]
MSSPSNVKADGVVPKNDGHVARRDPSPEDAFNCSSSDRPPKHTVKLALSCKNLAVAETSGYQPPDPYAVLLASDSRGNWEEVSRTEILQNSRDPEFETPLICTFLFERPQRLKAVVLCRSKKKAAGDESSLGEAEFTLREAVTARGNRLQLPLQDGALDASCTLIVLDSSDLNSDFVARFQVDGASLGSPGSSKVFLRAVRAGRGGAEQPVMQTQALASGSRLAWAVEASVAELCDGDFGAPLKLEVWEAIGGRCTLIGAARTDLRSMLDSKTSSLQLSAQGKEAGALAVGGVSVQRRLSFLDYMAGGCEIQCMIAIDFSGSNAPTTDPTSCHYAGPDGQTASVYERAMAAFGAIMQFYDPLRSFPLWGFGGQGKQTCYALNGQAFQPEVKGLRGLLRTYRKALHRATFTGPALFAPVVIAARDLVEQLSLVQHRYFLLVILTTSVGDDLEEFRAALMHAAGELALSVIVVGIGSADFCPLETAVSSKNGMESAPSRGSGAGRANGRGALASLDTRNMTQFTRLQPGKGADYDAVAQRLLSNLPAQFMEYFHKRGIIPKTFSSDLVQQTKVHIARARSVEQ